MSSQVLCSQRSLARSPDAVQPAPRQPAAAEPSRPAPGNQALLRLLRAGGIQPKLTVNEPGDRYEEEADRVADQVMRMPEPGSTAPAVIASADAEVQRKCAACAAGGAPCAGCAEEEEKQVQRKEEPAGAAPAQAPQAGSSVPRGGEPLPAAVRGFFEPRFGRDFSGVRLHTGSAADASARSLHALAYTHGRDLVFRSGHYAPASVTGRRLLAHELTHVVQQGRGGGPLPAIQRQCSSKNMAACSEEDLLTAVGIGEAGNINDADGQQGVMNVVQNRAADPAFGGGIRSQATLILNAEPHSPPAVDRLTWSAPGYKRCRPLAQKVLGGTGGDPTLGALFFDQCCERQCDQFCTGYLGDGSSGAHYYARRATAAEAAFCNDKSKNSASCPKFCGTAVSLAVCDNRCCKTGRKKGAVPGYPGMETPKTEAPKPEAPKPQSTPPSEQASSAQPEPAATA